MEKGKLSFLDLLFISFGGQAPFISLLTFGTVMVGLVGEYGAFAMVLSTLVVLFNGLVVYFLSMRYRRGGGYYTYSLYSLTPRLGLNTGWTYLMYALSYGGTLLAGGAYVLYLALSTFSFPSGLQWALALAVSSTASALVVVGIRVSANYATVMSIVEVVAIILLSVYFLFESGWRFYNPVPSSFTPSLFEAVVFGLGIPAGYGSIAPLGREASSRDIGRAAIAVLLLGGGLAAFFFYSLGDVKLTSDLVDYLLTRFGIVGLLALGFIALNDGTLGGMVYVLSASRTFREMAEDGVFPKFFAREVRGKPLYSELFVSAVFVSALTALANYVGLSGEFALLGGLAGLFNLFVHISANLSLIRVASKRIRKHLHEVAVGVVATLISLGVFLDSLPSFNKYTVYLFFGWIILGFFFAEFLEIARGAHVEEERR